MRPSIWHFGKERAVARSTAVVVYGILMVVLIVGVDVLFFRHHLWARLLVNIGIVLVFAAFYLRFLRRS